MAHRTCSVEGCERPHHARGFCAAHLKRVVATGSAGPARIAPRDRDHPSVCLVDGCEKPYGALGYCKFHWKRVRNWGNPFHPPIRSTSYSAAHSELRRARGSASLYRCVDCDGPAEQWSYDYQEPNPRLGGADGISPYSFDIDRYDPRCAICHVAFDRSR